MLCCLDKLGNLSYVDALLGTCNVFGIFFEKGGSLGQPDGPVGTGACCQAWWPKINLQIHLVKEESWLLQVLLTSTYVPWPICVHAYTHTTYTLNKYKKNCKGFSLGWSPRLRLFSGLSLPRSRFCGWVLLCLTDRLSPFAVCWRQSLKGSTPRKPEHPLLPVACV